MKFLLKRRMQKDDKQNSRESLVSQSSSESRPSEPSSDQRRRSPESSPHPTSITTTQLIPTTCSPPVVSRRSKSPVRSSPAPPGSPTVRASDPPNPSSPPLAMSYPGRSSLDAEPDEANPFTELPLLRGISCECYIL